MIIVSDRILKFFNFFLSGVNAGGITFYPFIICASDTRLTPDFINHERIHLRQQLELLIIPFYIWYFIEYYTKGYMNVSFEKEAYGNDKNLNYLKDRRMFSFLKYF